MMRNDLTELVFIIDRSGSMYGLEKDTIGGFNSVLAQNKALPGDANVTTILFDHEISLLHDRLPIQAIAPITENDYRVRGSTALLDAIGAGIEKITAGQRHTADAYRASKVQFVIITDGLENASRRFRLSQIRDMITLQQKEYGWDFLFLGANMDAISTASDMGIHADRAVTAMSDKRGTGLQYEAVARANMAYRADHAPTADWKQDVEADTAQRGGNW